MALSDAIAQLREEESLILRQCEEAVSVIHKCQPSLSKVQEALSALGERPNGKLAGLSAANRKPRVSKPAANKEEVKQLIADAIKENGELPEEKLKAEVERRLLALGKTRQGFVLRFREAIKERSQTFSQPQ